MRDGVGLEDVGSEFYEYLANHRLAAGNAAGQPDFEHEATSEVRSNEVRLQK